jgi:outer membrane lipoprotein
MKSLLPLAAALLLAGCVTAPKALQGEFAAIEPGQAARDGRLGERVRWGGRIVSVDPQAARTCFEIVGVRLGSDGRPLARDQSSGRFLACRTGFYDPEIFKAGREITLTGQVDGYEDRKVGEYDYRYPRLAADVVFLWPERRDVDVIIERSPFYW